MAEAIPSHLTTGEVARRLCVPIWKVRRAADALGQELPRAGSYRLIPRQLVPQIAARCSGFDQQTGAVPCK